MGLPQPLEKLPIGAEFHKKVEVVLVFEVSVEGSDEPMFQEELDAQLPRNLAHVFLLPDLALGHHLHAAEEASGAVDYHHYLAELPLAHASADREVCLGKLAREGFRLHGSYGLCELCYDLRLGSY